jgi:hypothetical protein
LTEELRFYFDESVELAVSEQLALAGLDVVSAHSLDRLGDDDPQHLAFATEMRRVLCTYDADFVALAQEDIQHAGIVYGAMQRFTIGDWIRYIRRLHATKTPEDVLGLVFYVERW